MHLSKVHPPRIAAPQEGLLQSKGMGRAGAGVGVETGRRCSAQEPAVTIARRTEIQRSRRAGSVFGERAVGNSNFRQQSPERGLELFEQDLGSLPVRFPGLKVQCKAQPFVCKTEIDRMQGGSAP